MKVRICLAGLVSLVLALADAAEAVPEDAVLQDVAVRPDGTTVYLFGLTMEDGTFRIGFSTRSNPADPATESPVRFVPRSLDALPDQQDLAPFRLSANGRFIVGTTLNPSSSGPVDPLKGLLFDTLPNGALPVVVSPRQVPLIPPEQVGAVSLGVGVVLADVSNVGVAVGTSGLLVPAGLVGRGLRATPDGVAQPLESFEVLIGNDLRTLRSVRPSRIAAGGGVIGVLGWALGGMSEPIFLDQAGLLQLSRPALGDFDGVFPVILANDATRQRGRIVAQGSFESVGSGILVYENAMATPTFYPLATSSLQDAALDASSFLARVVQDGSETGGDTLLRVGGADAQQACAAGVEVGTIQGRPVRRVEGAGVIASSPAGFRFCFSGDREGEVLIGHDLVRELAAIEGSGFAPTPELVDCFVGDNGSQASIFCEGTNVPGQVVQFSDRARLVRPSPFQLPPCGSGGMQAAFVIPLLAMLGRRGRSHAAQD